MDPNASFPQRICNPPLGWTLLLTVAVAVALAAPAITRAQDADEQEHDDERDDDEAHDAFVDTRLSFTFGDDDILAPTGEQVPISPLPSFEDRRAYQLFFDNLNYRFSTRETLTHLALYNKMPAFVDNLTTEAALVVRLNLDQVTWSDTGSYIRLRYEPWNDAPDDGLSLTVFPFDSERFRLGYLYTLSFGGAEFVPRRSILRAPGFKLQLDRGIGYYFIGMKTIPARVPLDVALDTGGTETEVETVRVNETQYSVLGGAGIDLFGDTLRAEFGAGYFQQGVLDLPSYPRARIYSFGGAARIAYHRNMPVGTSIDFRLYTNDPNRPFRVFRPVQYTPGELGYLISAEAVVIEQHLANSDRANDTTFETALAGAVQARLQYDHWRFEATGLYRNLSFILKNVPSLDPFLSIPKEAVVNPEFFVAGTADYHFPGPRLTLGVSLGIQLPATVSSAVTSGPADAARTLVVRQEGNFSILPPGAEDATPIIGGRVRARIDISEMLFGFVWLQYVRDENQTRLVVSSNEGTRRVFQRADQLGFGTSLAARF